MNHWLNILEAFEAGKFPNYYYGLTPRFIIGACQIPIGKKFDTAEDAYEVTMQMFIEMKEFNVGGLIVTNINCSIHNGPVLRLSSSKWTKNSLSTTFEEIWRRYGDEIANGDYHINNIELKTLKDI